jgi:hypothetical protein
MSYGGNFGTCVVDPIRSNRLVYLAAGIRAEHDATAAALKRGVLHAMAAGALLNEAKSLLKHGQWLPWLRDHCSVSERTARLYMRLADNRAQIEGQIGSVADLSVRGAITLISAPKQCEQADLVLTTADALADELAIVDFQARQVERNKRKAAFAAIESTLHSLKEIDAGAAVFELLGDQLVSEIEHCKNLLLESDSLHSSRLATYAIAKAKGIALDMLERAGAV